jgi:hypothetical protein
MRGASLITSTFLLPDSPLWQRALEECPHDLYHLPGYVLAEAEWLGAEPCAYLYREADDWMLIPLLLRPTPAADETGNRDAVSPYGYSAPVFSRHASHAFQLKAMMSYHSAACEHGVVASFIRLHPLLEFAALDSLRYPWATVESGCTVDLPLEADEQSWLSSVGKNHRSDIRRLRTLGYTAEVGTSDALAAFTPTYLEEMERLEAAPMYRYSEQYIERLRTLLKPNLTWAAIRGPAGDIACVGVFSVVCDMMQYHLSGTRSKHRKVSPMKLLLAEMRKVAQEANVQHFHLGGGVGARLDALYTFKARFGGKVYPFRTVRVVHDHTRFADEIQRWHQRAGHGARLSTDFFPPYRAPLGATS